MSQRVSDVMTQKPVVLDAKCTVTEAARRMRNEDLGDVLVQEQGAVCGIVTDRDLVVRCIAEGDDPQEATLGEICTKQLATLDADDSVDEAVEMMESQAIRRLPVLKEGQAVGILSLGDLAKLRDPESVLGKISAAPASH